MTGLLASVASPEEARIAAACGVDIIDLKNPRAGALGALPLALGTAEGAELRQPLGLSVLGGLFLSQWLTLYTTPVVFVTVDRWRQRWLARGHGR